MTMMADDGTPSSITTLPTGVTRLKASVESAAKLQPERVGERRRGVKG
jgi:hypothetical protein